MKHLTPCLETGDAFGTLRIHERRENGTKKPLWDMECLCGNLIEKVPQWKLTSGRLRTCADGHAGAPMRLGQVLHTPAAPLGAGLVSEILTYEGWKPEPAYYKGYAYTRLAPHYRVRITLNPTFYQGPERIKEGVIWLVYLSDLQVRALPKAFWHPLEFFGDAILHPPQGLRAQDAPPAAYYRKKPKGGHPPKNLQGRVFGHWKVVDNKNDHALRTRCLCTCGTNTWVRRVNLTRLSFKGMNGSLSCGCQDHTLQLEPGKEYAPKATVRRQRRVASGVFFTLPRRGFQVLMVERRTEDGKYVPYRGSQPHSRELIDEDLKGGRPRYRVLGRCECGNEVVCSLVQARGRAASRGCRCHHYLSMTPAVQHMHREYVRCILKGPEEAGADLSAYYETVLTDRGWERLPTTVVDRMEQEGILKERPSGFKFTARRLWDQKITGPDWSWGTFAGFCRDVPRPRHPGQRLIKLDHNQPWTAENVAWCVADRAVFTRIVPREQVEEANRRNHKLVLKAVYDAGGNKQTRIALVGGQEVHTPYLE